MTDLKKRIEEILNNKGYASDQAKLIMKLIKENYIPKESIKDTPITKFLKNEKEELF